MAVTANYETVMITSMKKGEEGIQAIVEKFKAMIEKRATLKNVDEWGREKALLPYQQRERRLLCSFRF